MQPLLYLPFFTTDLSKSILFPQILYIYIYTRFPSIQIYISSGYIHQTGELIPNEQADSMMMIRMVMMMMVIDEEAF